MFPTEILQHIASSATDITVVIACRCTCKALQYTPRIVDTDLLDLNKETNPKYNYQRLIHISKAATLRGYISLFDEFVCVSTTDTFDAAIVSGSIPIVRYLQRQGIKQSSNSLYLCAKYNRRIIYEMLDKTYYKHPEKIYAVPDSEWMQLRHPKTMFNKNLLFKEAVKHNNLQLVRKLIVNNTVTSEHIILSPSREMNNILLQRVYRPLLSEALIKLGQVSLFTQMGDGWICHLIYAFKHKYYKALYSLAGIRSTDLVTIIKHNMDKIKLLNKYSKCKLVRYLIELQSKQALIILKENGISLWSGNTIYRDTFTDEMLEFCYKNIPDFVAWTKNMLIRSTGLRAIMFFDAYNIQYSKMDAYCIAKETCDVKLLEYLTTVHSCVDSPDIEAN